MSDQEEINKAEEENKVETTVVEDNGDTDSGEETDDAELAVTTDVKPEKYRWEIPNFSQVQKDTYDSNEKYFSEIFEIGGCKWRMMIFANGNPSGNLPAKDTHLSLYLEVPERDTLPAGWRRQCKFWLNLINQEDEEKNVRESTEPIMSEQCVDWGFPRLCEFKKFLPAEAGFIKDDKLVLEAEIVVNRVYTEKTWSAGRYHYNTREETGFVGLRNQGATCYLNSLMQGLYHIGAFRRAVYMMPTDKDDVSKSVPLALQRLFYRLQFNKDAVSTKELTRSFGWSDYESFKQHDVQELNRVLMDNLETKMKGTVAEKAPGYIESLYKGTLLNFIECINVDFVSEREEAFYDLSLVVKGTRDIYESFERYCEVEMMDGDNQYRPNEELGLQDARKGVRFDKMPPVLCLQLKRWEMNYNTFQPYKVNDLYQFYPVLDLSNYIDRTKNTDSGVYHLHAVLVHSGGTHGGHYYAYVRPTTQPEWFKFNDSSVSAATEKEAIDDNWGGTETTRYMRYGKIHTYSHTRSANAYMLIYVRETEAHEFMNDSCVDVIPKHLSAVSEEHLFMDLKVATAADLATHDQTRFDLIRTSELKALRVNRTWPLSRFKEQAAVVFGIPAERQRYWCFVKRDNDTVRIDYSLSDKQLDTQLVSLRAIDKVKMLFVEDADPEPGQNRPAVIGDPELGEKRALIFFKHYDPATATVRFVGSALFDTETEPVSAFYAKIRELDAEANAAELAATPDDADLLLFEELMPTRIDPVDPSITLAAAEVLSGDIIVYMRRQDADVAATHRLPTPVEWYPHMRLRVLVRFRKLDKPRDADAEFTLELQKTDKYSDIAEKLAAHLSAPPKSDDDDNDDDDNDGEAVSGAPAEPVLATHIRLTGNSPHNNQPRLQPVDRKDKLPKMLRPYYGPATDLLYYEVLSVPLDEIEHMKKLKVSFQTEGAELLLSYDLLVPKQGVVSDVFEALKLQPEVKEALANDKFPHTGKFRLVEVFSHKIYKVFESDDPIARNLHEYHKYTVLELSPEEVNANTEGDDAPDKIVPVSHYESATNGTPTPFGRPFMFALIGGETVADVKRRIQAFLGVEDEEFAEWRVSIASYHRDTFLEDDQLVDDLKFDDYQFLGLFHKNNAPPSIRSSGRTTNYRSGGGAIKIHN